MEKIVNTLIDEAVQKVDTYTNNGSTWLIFTDDKRWVIELTKDGRYGITIISLIVYLLMLQWM